MSYYFERPLFQNLNANTIGRDFIVGDLHGCFDELYALLNHVHFDYTRDRLFCTGDLIHRGKQPEECLSLLNESWFYCVVGNHDTEEMYHKGTAKEQAVWKEYHEQLENLPYMIHVRGNVSFFVVHAEIGYKLLYGNKKPNGGTMSDRDYMLSGAFGKNIEGILKAWSNGTQHPLVENYAELIWGRDIFTAFEQNYGLGGFTPVQKDGLKIFCGHNIVPFVQVRGHQIYCDTGACFEYVLKNNEHEVFKHNPYGFFYLSIINVQSGEIFGARSKTMDVFSFDLNLYQQKSD